MSDEFLVARRANDEAPPPTAPPSAGAPVRIPTTSPAQTFFVASLYVRLLAAAGVVVFLVFAVLTRACAPLSH